MIGEDRNHDRAAQPLLWEVATTSAAVVGAAAQPALFSAATLPVVMVAPERLTITFDERGGRWVEGDIAAAYSQDLLLRAGAPTRGVREPFTLDGRKYVVVGVEGLLGGTPTFVALALVPEHRAQRVPRTSPYEFANRPIDDAGAHFDGLRVTYRGLPHVLCGPELRVGPAAPLTPEDIRVDAARLRCGFAEHDGGDIARAYSCDTLMHRQPQLRAPAEVGGRLCTVVAVSPGAYALGYEIVPVAGYTGPQTRPRLDDCAGPLASLYYLYTGKRAHHDGVEYVLTGMCRRFVPTEGRET